MIQIVSQELARVIAKAEDAAFASGSGTGQPTGIDTYAPIYTVAAGGALAFNHFHSAFYGMPQSYREGKGLVWLMHRNNILLTAGLSDTVGRPIFDNLNPMSNLTNSTRTPQVLGIPVIENNDISEKTIYLVDLDYYWIAQSRKLSIDIATEATIGGTIDMAKGAGYYVAGNNLWERNEIAVRAEEKIDGELVTTRALTTITATRP
jgi:HK97 family phage major capsid protein